MGRRTILNLISMKRFVERSLLGLTLCTFLCAGCSGGNKKEVAEDPDASEMKADDGLKTIQVGDVSVTWIQDNAEDKLMPVSLFPDAPQELIEKLSLQAGVPSSVSVFLVETDSIQILFDTGLGAKDSQLPERLKQLGVAPEDIRYLYLTHFHSDHIGGMMRGDSVVFPIAEVYASKKEYEGWMKMPVQQKGQVVKTMEVYKDRLHLFEFGETLPGGVMTYNASGHTPGHTVYQVGTLLIIGDLIHGAALQIPHPEICATYDMDKEAAVKARKQYLQEADENQFVMAGMHLPAPGFK